MNLFYIPDCKLGEQILIPENEAKHSIKALRLGKGNSIHITNGNGKLFKALILDENIKNCKAELIDVVENQECNPNKLHIGISVLKNPDRLEWFVEKAVEIGINQITPLMCDHTEKKGFKTDRLHNICVSAMKQSLGVWLPKVNPLLTFSEFVKTATAMSKYIACCQGTPEHLQKLYEKQNSCIVLIGPEGDFSNSEIKLATSNNYVPVSLGLKRYRSETAALVASHIITLQNEI